MGRKHYNKQQIETFFNSNLSSFKHNELSISKIDTYSGDIYTFIVRQKPKLVYDCEIKLTIQNKHSEEVEVELSDVNNHETDSTFEFSFKGGNKDLISLIMKIILISIFPLSLLFLLSIAYFWIFH